jgi:hypothetical protein
VRARRVVLPATVAVEGVQLVQSPRNEAPSEARFAKGRQALSRGKRKENCVGKNKVNLEFSMASSGAVSPKTEQPGGERYTHDDADPCSKNVNISAAGAGAKR